MQKKSVIIIGAGWSGIGVAGALAFNNFEDYMILEQTECFGGFWKYHTYDSVRMHDMSRLYKTPEHLAHKNHFLTREEVPTYLSQYAQHYGIEKKTLFGTKVIRIYQDGEDWIVECLQNDSTTKITFSTTHLCIATSYCRMQFIPEILKSSMKKFTGKILHSDDYKRPTDFPSTCKSILIIGGGHSASEISTELTDAGFHASIAHRGGQYFMKQSDWSSYLSKQNLKKSLDSWRYSMADLEFKDLVESYDKEFGRQVLSINDRVGWKVPNLEPASFILFQKKTFIDDDHFLDLLQNGTIRVIDTVREIIEDGVILMDSQKMKFDGIILCTGFQHGIGEFLEDSESYLSSHRYAHLPPERTMLPLTDGRCTSTVKKNLYFPGFDYGINQRVDFALYSWNIGEKILSQILGEKFTPEIYKSF